MSEVPYLTLETDVEESIRNDLACARRHPLACPDEAVVRRHDLSNDTATVLRPAFVRDIEKIMNMPAYARYAGKTQVFSFTENDDICRRGLHVQLVSKVARNIGRLLGLNTDLIEAIALGHDVGHTPFGHAGERYLSACLNRRCGRYFNHNVHSVRVLDQLFQRNVSLQTLDGVLCHNGEFAQQELQMGNVSSFAELDATVEACSADERVIASLRPSTLEGCVVRVADMIAYLGKDRQDALVVGGIDSLDAFESDYIGTSNAQIINNLTVDIVNNSYGTDRICMSKRAFDDLRRAKRQNYEIIYGKEGMNGNDETMIASMFERMYDRLLDDAQRGDESSPLVVHHADYLAQQSRSIDAQAYLQGDPDTIVVDFLASMTDSYFIALYRHLFPDDERPLFTRTYCSNLHSARVACGHTIKP
ncbi:deoxyguanosinetriphosphate triphosphohydrolase family protein [Adlercreutzia sp. ZJ138]|uniref:deoxyguanosinetriphosphate triphosphohydrolase family protein n=1 Tax=Adlercreutzia sp. ZJ138 TaxID=2709405 RepID=UPI001F14D15A|nr:HD domain-containing protein [Adlercreutzia sp. ZJ138]